jgi:hypothetical protein
MSMYRPLQSTPSLRLIRFLYVYTVSKYGIPISLEIHLFDIFQAEEILF